VDDKIGVFIATGYGIADALDIDALREVATGEFHVPFCETVESCEGPGLDAIREAIAREGLTHVVVAGISPRRYDHGSFPDDVIVEAHGFPRFEQDEQVMLYLEASGDGRYRVLGYQQGHFRVVTRLDGVTQVIPTDRLSVPGAGTPGLQAAYFYAPDLTGEPVLVRTEASVDFEWKVGESPLPPRAAWSGPAALTLHLPAGAYRAEWVDTRSGAVTKTEDIDHAGGWRGLLSPLFEGDVGLAVRKVGR